MRSKEKVVLSCCLIVNSWEANLYTLPLQFIMVVWCRFIVVFPCKNSFNSTIQLGWVLYKDRQYWNFGETLSDSRLVWVRRRVRTNEHPYIRCAIAFCMFLQWNSKPNHSTKEWVVIASHHTKQSSTILQQKHILFKSLSCCTLK